MNVVIIIIKVAHARECPYHCYHLSYMYLISVWCMYIMMLKSTIIHHNRKKSTVMGRLEIKKCSLDQGGGNDEIVYNQNDYDDA